MTVAHIELEEYHRIIKEREFLRGENAALKAVVEKFTSTNSQSTQLVCSACRKQFTYGVCHHCYCDALPDND